MKFVCDRCNTRYSISDDKVRGKVLKIRCKTCGSVVAVDGKQLDVPEPEPDRDRTVLAAMPIPENAFREPEPPPPPPAERTVLAAMPLPPDAIPTPAPAPKVPTRDWHFSVDGKSQGPFSVDNVIEEISGLPANADVHLWNEEMDSWKPLVEVSGIWRLVQHRRRVLAAPPKPAKPAKPSAPPPRPSAPPPLPRAAAKPGLPARKRSTTAGNEAILKPVSGVIAASSPVEDEPTPVPSGPKVVPAPELVTPPVRPSGSRPAVSSLPDPDQYPPTPPPVAMPPARSTAHPFAAAPAAHAAPPAPFGGAPLPAPGWAPGGQPGAMAGPRAVLPAGMGASVAAAPMQMPAPAPFFPETQQLHPSEADSALVNKARLVRRHRMMKYIIAVLLAMVVVCVVVAWNAVQRSKDVRTVVVEKPVERKLSPEELAEKLAIAAGEPRPNAPGTPPMAAPKPRAPVVKAAPHPGKPSAQETPGTVDQAAAARFAQSNEGLRLPVGGLAAGSSRPTVTVSQDAIAQVVNANKGGIKTCYQRALLRDKSLVQGKINVRLTIGISGRVKSVVISGPPEFRTLDPCIKDVVQRWVFPTSSDEYGTEFPFLFQGVQ